MTQPRSKLVSTVLIAAGILLVVIGASVSLSPNNFYQSYGIELAGQPNLSSELRAPAGMLLSLGILIMLGAFKRAITNTAVLLASLVYLSYGTARLIGFAVDGQPSSAMVNAAVIEILAGMICLGTLAYHHRKVRH